MGVKAAVEAFCEPSKSILQGARLDLSAMLSFTKVKSKDDNRLTKPVLDQGTRRLDVVNFSRQATPTPPFRPDSLYAGATAALFALKRAMIISLYCRRACSGFSPAA